MSIDKILSKDNGEIGDSKKIIAANIFRQAMIDGATEKYGTPVNLLKINGWFVTLFFLSLFTAALAVMCMTHYTRKETVSGQVAPVAGALRITSQYSGIAEKIGVKEGDHVDAGDELFFISSRPTLENGKSLEGTIKLIQQAQQKAQEAQSLARLAQVRSQIDELSSRRNGLEDDIVALDKSSKLLMRRRVLQSETLTAYRSLETKGMASSTMVRQYEDVLLGIDQQIEETARTRARDNNEIAQTLPRLQGLKAELEQYRSEALSTQAESREKQVNSDAQFSRRLVAPVSGQVTAMHVHAGSLISVGETLAILVPLAEKTTGDQLEIELWAPSRAIGFVRPGSTVRLMYDAFPYEVFGVGTGVVSQIAGAPTAAADIRFDLSSKEQYFRILVKIDKSTLTAYGKKWPLIPGMRLTADLILEKQSLIEWALEPLRAINNRNP